MFIRSLKEAQIVALKENKLFTEKLMTDIKAGVIFPAIRKDEIHFYYNGSSLFVYSGKSFRYNKKYWYGKDSKGVKSAENTFDISFFDKYEELKEKCDKYENEKKKKDAVGERELLAKLYKHTFTNENESDCIVLDVEVRTNIENDQKKCDMVLLNKETKELLFVEGKFFSDKRVYSTKKGDIEVITQVKGYSEQILKHNEKILKQYKDCVEIFNELFQSNLPEPEKLLPYTKLVVYRCNVGRYDIKKRNVAGTAIDEQLNSVLWLYQDKEATLEEIFNNTNKYNVDE